MLVGLFVKKRIFCIICTIIYITLFSFSLAAQEEATKKEPFFTGFAGMLGDFHNNIEKTHFSPQFTTQTFMTGQLDLNGKTIIRGGFDFRTDDLIDNGIFKDTPATFKVDEFSITQIIKGYDSTSYLSAFVGCFEPIGSDVFLERQFGLHSISSLITQSWSGLNGSTVYPFYGTGVSYVYHAKAPIALGFYGYYEFKEFVTEHETSGKVISTDLRFACNFNMFTLDLAAGLGFPIEDKYENDEETDKVVLLIRTADMHAGVTFLLGNVNSTSFLIKAGFQAMNIDPNNSKHYHICNDNRYFLSEFRAKEENFILSLAAYSIPIKTIQHDMPFMHDPLGFNIGMQNGNKIQYGLNLMPCFSRYFDDVLDAIKDDQTKDGKEIDDIFNFYVDPYLSADIYNGNLKIQFSCNLMNLSEKMENAFKLILGFKTRL